MFSLRLALVAATALVARVAAVNDYPIDPTTVPLGTRKAWCTSETTQCPLICLDTGASGRPQVNTCDIASLAYGCVCSNGLSPNLTQYSLTLPYYKCQQFQSNCVAACGLADNDCSLACRVNNVCGASSPKGAATAGASGSIDFIPMSTPAPTAPIAGNTIQTGFAGQSVGSGDGGGGSGASASMSAPISLALAITGLMMAPLLFL